MNNLTETQKNFRKQMGELNQEYNKNNNKGNILVTVIIIFIISFIVFSKINFNKDSIKFINRYDKRHQIVGEYIKEFELDNLALTYNKFIERINKSDTNNIISEMKSELLYIESKLYKIKEYKPNSILNEVHVYTKLFFEQILYVYKILIKDFYDDKLQLENDLLNKIHNDYRKTLIELADDIGMKYTKLNDGTINFEWTIYK